MTDEKSRAGEESISIDSAAAKAAAGPSEDAAKRWADSAVPGSAPDHHVEEIMSSIATASAGRAAPRLPALSLGNAALFHGVSRDGSGEGGSTSGEESDADEIVEL